MANRNINSLIFNSANYNIAPVMRYYKTKVGNDYNDVEGYVMQWPNGLQIVIGSYSLGSTNMQIYRWGTMYRSTKQYLPHFDAEFKTVPIVVHNCAGPQGGGSMGGSAATGWMYGWNSPTTTTRMGEGFFCDPVSRKPNLLMEFVAIGDWKTYEGGSTVNFVEKIKKNNIDLYMCPEITDYTLSNGKDKVIKFQNGLMIITGVRNLGTKSMTTAWGSLYETSSSFSVGTFSEPFVSVPHVIMSPTSNSTNCLLEVVLSTSTTNIGNTWAISATSTSGKVEIAYQAIGMWK